MDTIVQAIINYSKVEVDTIKIKSPTAKTTNTGPVSATMSPMTVNLVGPAGPFAKLDLPEVKTKSKGATVIVPDQRVQITDMGAFIAYVKSLQLDEMFTMNIDNGEGIIKAFGMKSKIIYKKPLDMLGMNGPRTEILKTELLEDGTFINMMKIINPSPVEIDMGPVSFALINASGEVLAIQKSNVYIGKGETVYEAIGQVVKRGAVDGMRIIGAEEERQTWIQNSLNFFDTPITLTPELENLLRG